MLVPRKQGKADRKAGHLQITSSGLDTALAAPHSLGADNLLQALTNPSERRRFHQGPPPLAATKEL